MGETTLVRHLTDSPSVDSYYCSWCYIPVCSEEKKVNKLTTVVLSIFYSRINLILWILSTCHMNAGESLTN